jgi:hypothetical protein
MFVIAAALAIVTQDHASLRAAPQSSSAELTRLSQGEVVEIRGQSPGYLKVYDYHLERGGYLRSDAVHPVALTPADAPELLAILRFLRDTPGFEALGISYGAAYLRAAPAAAPSSEPCDAIARMAERLADQASGGTHVAEATAHLALVQRFGIHTHSFERNGQTRVCYDGELYRRVLALPASSAEQRANAALGLTRPECADPDLSPLLRASLDTDHARLLEGVAPEGITPLTTARLNLRRAVVWATVTYEQARAGTGSAIAAGRALDALSAVRAEDLGADHRAEYSDALVRVSAIRWAAAPATSQTGPLVLTAAPGAPGQTCLVLAARDRPDVRLAGRCTYGIVWLASAQTIAQGHALVLGVQPLQAWRELWVFHPRGSAWAIDVVSPGVDDPEEGYVDFAGFAPDTRRLLTVREAREHGAIRRRFEVLRLDDLVPVRQGSTADLLLDFRRWQDSQWQRDTLALR